MNTDDPNYDYFRTAEEKRLVDPMPQGLEWSNDCGITWLLVETYSRQVNPHPDVIYRRRKPAPQYPRWVKCSERLPEVGVFVFVSKNEHVQNEPVYRLNPPSAGLWFSGRAKWFSDAFTHWYDIGTIPPPPKAEPEKDEFEEWLDIIPIQLHFKDDDNASIKFTKAWMWEAFNTGKNAALASKESKKGGGE